MADERPPSSFDLVSDASKARHEAVLDKARQMLKALKLYTPDQANIGVQNILSQVHNQIMHAAMAGKQPISAESYAWQSDNGIWSMTAQACNFTVPPEFPYNSEGIYGNTEPYAPEVLAVLALAEPPATAKPVVVPTRPPAARASIQARSPSPTLSPSPASSPLLPPRRSRFSPLGSPGEGPSRSGGSGLAIDASSEDAFGLGPSGLAESDAFVTSPALRPRESSRSPSLSSLHVEPGPGSPARPQSEYMPTPYPGDWSKDSIDAGDNLIRQRRLQQDAKGKATAQALGLSADEYWSEHIAPKITEKYTYKKRETPLPEGFRNWSHSDDGDDGDDGNISLEEAKAMDAEFRKKAGLPPAAQSIPFFTVRARNDALAAEDQQKIRDATVPVRPPVALPKTIGASAGSKAPRRPVREDLPENTRDRVLTLKERQLIWDHYFENCPMQVQGDDAGIHATEPLQLQIPRQKRFRLLGERVSDSQGRVWNEGFEKLRFALHPAIEIVFQDPSDKKFPYILLYIGIRSFHKVEPLAISTVMGLRLTWAGLLAWALEVNDNWQVDAHDMFSEFCRRKSNALLPSCQDIQSIQDSWAEVLSKSRYQQNAPKERPVPKGPTPEQLAQRKRDKEALDERRAIVRSNRQQAERAEEDRIRSEIQEMLEQADRSFRLESFFPTLDIIASSGDASRRVVMVARQCNAWAEDRLDAQSRGKFITAVSSWAFGFNRAAKGDD